MWRGASRRVTRVVLSLAVPLLVLLLSGPALAFTDTATSPYSEAIDELADRQIVGGYDDGTFRPTKPVWRAQFAKMVTGVFSLGVEEGDELAPFTDLGPDDPTSVYPHEYVAAAYFFGITKGKTQSTFAPWEDISRASLVTAFGAARRCRTADSLGTSVLPGRSLRP